MSTAVASISFGRHGASTPWRYLGRTAMRGKLSKSLPSADLRPAAAGVVHLPSLRSGSARSSISLGALPLRAIDFASGICSLVFMLGGLRVLLVGESRLLVLGGARWVRDRTGATVLTERSASHDYFGPRYNSRTFFGPHIIWYGSHF